MGPIPKPVGRIYKILQTNMVLWGKEESEGTRSSQGRAGCVTGEVI